MDDIKQLKALGHKKRPILSAIKEHCKDCSGDDSPKRCWAKNCPLYPYRLGHNPFNKRILTEEQKQQALKNLEKHKGKA